MHWRKDVILSAGEAGATRNWDLPDEVWLNPDKCIAGQLRICPEIASTFGTHSPLTLSGVEGCLPRSLMARGSHPSTGYERILNTTKCRSYSVTIPKTTLLARLPNLHSHGKLG